MIRPLREVRREAEEKEVREALIEAYGCTFNAALLLDVSERTVQYKMTEYKISRVWARKMKSERARQMSLLPASGFAKK